MEEDRTGALDLSMPVKQGDNLITFKQEISRLPTVSPSVTSCSDSSSIEYMSNCPTDDAPRIKLTRPFKAYPKDPLALAINVTAVDAMLGHDSTVEAYTEFRKKFLAQIQASQPQGINAKMRRTGISTNVNHPQANDPLYWEKRRKNNEAAKRSRDARRAKEDEIAIRCAFLESENRQLKHEVKTLREQLQLARSVHLPY